MKFIHFYLFPLLLLFSSASPLYLHVTKAATLSATCVISAYNYTQNTTVYSPTTVGTPINATNPLIVNNTYTGIAVSNESTIGSYIITYNDTGVSFDGSTFELVNGNMTLSSINGSDTDIYISYVGGSTGSDIELIGSVQGGTGMYSTAIGSVFAIGGSYEISRLSNTLYTTTGSITLTATILVQTS